MIIFKELIKLLSPKIHASEKYFQLFVDKTTKRQVNTAKNK